MGFFNNFPYTNFHEMNLDWILKHVNELEKSVKEYEALNKIAYYGIWDISRNYEKWSIVSKENEAFISLQPVPPNVNITNGDFWLKVADLDPRIASIDSRLTTLNGEFTEATGKIANAENSITTNTNAIDTLEKTVNSAKVSLNNVIFIGDSIMYGEGSSDPNNNNLANMFAKNVTMKKWERYAYRGSGFTNPGVSGKTYKQAMEQDIIPAYAGEENDVTLIIVEGGWNDTYYNNNDFGSVQEPVKEFFGLVSNTFPNAKVVYMFNPINTIANFNTLVWFGIQQAIINLGIVNMAKSWSWLITQDGLYRGTYNDNVHPNDLGYTCMAAKLFSALFGTDQGCSNGGGFFGASGAALRWYLQDGVMNVSIAANNVQPNAVLFTADEIPEWLKPNAHDNTFVIGSTGGYCYLYQSTDGSIAVQGVTQPTNINGAFTIQLLLTMGKSA